MDKGSLEVLVARGLSLEEIGRRFDRHPSTVAYWLKKHGLEAVNRDKHVAKGAIPVTTLEPLVQAGLSIAQIAEKVGRSKATVRHWLRRHGLQTEAARRAGEIRGAKDEGLHVIALVCRNHGETEFVVSADGSYGCRRCRVESVARRRRRIKTTLVAEAGGKCVLCGYGRCMAALAFHHLDPSQKRLSISQNGMTLALTAIRAEAAKCALVCANCHAEIESGAVSLPDTVPEADRQENE
jgi:transposase